MIGAPDDDDQAMLAAAILSAAWADQQTPGELVFFSGPMDSGKSTLALQLHFTQSTHGRRGLIFTCRDRLGQAQVSSRIGLTHEGIEVHEGFDFWTCVVDDLTAGHKVDFLVCDEAQFYSGEQIEQLARVVDELGIDVFAFGIMADFRTELFPGSKRLVELADRVEAMPVRPLCWCGAPATHNARIIDGQMVTEGSQVAVGDTGEDESHGADRDESHGEAPEGSVSYEVLCRRHYARRTPKAQSGADLSPDVLPFDD